MDIMLLNNKTLRIKGKTASVVVDPTSSTGKTEADTILLLGNDPDFSDAKIEGARITLKGPGEFEVGGIKFSTISVGEKMVAKIDVDSIKVLIGSGEAVEKIQERMEGCDIAVINTDFEFNYSVLTSMEPKVLIVYGDKKQEVAKSLGKTDGMNTNKFSTAADKLPSEMQLVLLG